jgi:hypothetical protein
MLSPILSPVRRTIIYHLGLINLKSLAGRQLQDGDNRKVHLWTKKDIR